MRRWGGLEELDQNGTCTDNSIHGHPPEAETQERLAVGGWIHRGWQALAVGSSPPQPRGPPGLLLTHPSEGTTLR